MRSPFTLRHVTLATLLVAGATAAHATNGYFSHGYGIKAKGMGGAATAMAQDGFAGANNPAAAAYAGDRLDLGVDVFMPKRGVDSTAFGGLVESGKELFLVPEFGYNRSLSDKMSVGLSVYGNGGLNTDYGAPLNRGIDMMQLVVAPTLAYKVDDNHSVGISPQLVYQQFKGYGLGTGSGRYDSSSGVGVRLGYMGKVSDGITIGAAYAPKIKMSKFKDYAGLFLDGGNFDIPENYNLGIAIQASPTVQVALDYQRINFSGVPSVGQPNTAGGFGWSDINVVKVGVQWQMNERWTLRAGYNHGDNPVGTEDVTFGILAPGVTKSHITLGGTYAPSKNEEWSFAFMYAKKNSVSGPNIQAGNAPTTIYMSQKSLGIQYSRKF